MWWETLLANGGVITLVLGIIGFTMQWRREKDEPEISMGTAEAAIEFQRVQASDTVAARAIALSESTAKRMDDVEKEVEELKEENRRLKNHLGTLIAWGENIRRRWEEIRMQEHPPTLPPEILKRITE